MDPALPETDHAALYDGFAALFSEPMDAATIAACRARHQIVPLGHLPDAAWSKAPLQRALRIIEDTGDVETVTSLLNRDFCALFLGIQGPHRVVPACRSDYLDDAAKAAPALETLLADNGLALTDRFVEPADHIAVGLAIMAWLLNAMRVEDHIVIEPSVFLDTHLLSWVPAFAARCDAVDTTGCYAAFATLLHGFLFAERARLASVSLPLFADPSA
jgi:TorA specific chaperone